MLNSPSRPPLANKFELNGLKSRPLTAPACAWMCARLESDAAFLRRHNLMDYSLLLITEKNPDYVEDESDLKSAISFRSNKTTSEDLQRVNSNLLKR